MNRYCCVGPAVCECLLLYLHGLKPVLSFTLSGKRILYRITYAFILNHKYYKTITDIGIFRNSYNNFAYILIPITNLYLFTSLVCRTELLLILITNLYLLGLKFIADLFLFGSHTYSRLILMQISRRTHTYAELILIQK